jgi:hypothetical protein
LSADGHASAAVGCKSLVNQYLSPPGRINAATSEGLTSETVFEGKTVRPPMERTAAEVNPTFLGHGYTMELRRYQSAPDKKMYSFGCRGWLPSQRSGDCV